MSIAVKVLFVEDDDADVQLARRAMESDGLSFEWRRVQTEQALRAALVAFGPDVVLCDYHIPGYSGLAALQLVQMLQPGTPVVLISGFIGETAAIECLKRGAADYLLKSNLQRLGPAVRRAIADAGNRAHVRDVEQSHRQLAEVLEATQDLVVISDLDGRITFVNDAACQLLRQSPPQLLGTDWKDRFHARSPDSLSNEILSCAIRNGCWRGEITVTTSDGTDIATSQVVTAHRDTFGETRYFSTVARDLSDRRSFEAQILKLSRYDALTGLPNLARMTTVFADAVGESPGGLLAVAVINLDEFRLVDEGLGRPASDAVLKEISATLLTVVGHRGTVARAGPDEFMAILTGTRDRAAVGRLLRESLKAISVPRSLGGRDMQITASGGVAVYPGDGGEFESLRSKAGAAMHESKVHGPGLWRFHARSSERKARQRLSLESGLRRAIENSELTLAYQPQYDINEGAACGVEALARWRRPDGEIVPPGIFVPLAEQMNLITSLGAWVMREACGTVAGWDGIPECESVVCVNVSTRQIGADFCSMICRTLESTGIAASRLELEITESVLMEDAEVALTLLSRLRRLGVRIAVDDFGTGYSSLSYLSRLPLDRLKIDRSLIHGLGSGGGSIAIVQAVIELGNKFGFVVLAEGVETEGELTVLRQLGCQQVQGFLLARPVRAAAARRLMSKRWGSLATLPADVSNTTGSSERAS